MAGACWFAFHERVVVGTTIPDHWVWRWVYSCGPCGVAGVFYDQVPDSMRSLGIAFYLSVIGAGNFVSSFVITAVDHITDNGGKSWLGKDLNNSRLDRFYWLLACMAAANLCVYVFAARRYSYKNVQKVAVADCFGDELENGGPIP
ncbi:hypothetical protein PS1_009792 [Malus domestica]